MIATLYAVAMGVLLLFGANLLWLAVRFAWIDRLHYGPVPLDPETPPPMSKPWPSVTIQIPLYNERYVAERVIDACAAIDYPDRLLEIQVLDDSTDETSLLVEQRVAYWRKRGIDIVHIRRTDRTGFKAGALQNGLRLATGDLIAIFDADFIPGEGFLRRLVPHFQDPEVGLVQARWGHINADASLLTRIQAAGLDAHFAIDQYVRSRLGYFMNFNGTAGMWRASCIDDAGGWEGDTLTEDLDLSYRAQMKGWKFLFLPEVEVPAELPVDMNALRQQQFRWTKGGAETARKVLRRLWKSDQPLSIKLEGSMHLGNHVVFPFVLLVAAFHAPLALLRATGEGPPEIYYGFLSLGLFAFTGVFLVQLFTQRALYPDWPKRLALFPWFMAGSMGLALNNTVAVFEALIGRRTAFVRTPKLSAEARKQRPAWWKSAYSRVRTPRIVWAELGLALYSLAGLIAAVVVGEWAAVAFQSLFTLGFGSISGYTIYQTWQARRQVVQPALS